MKEELNARQMQDTEKGLRYWLKMFLRRIRKQEAEINRLTEENKRLKKTRTNTNKMI